ncbi:hypothetical protein CAPTEDRAFT_218807 [Capitella teleta]|uniref:Acyl-ACP thioesterase n=1 Tax=Capitella teleta TaxID=283909 RepID=R7UFW7_CAPTE|nr:hypothetical protein CAPTEDRAFT_218807 [Capitella teleta]|eukprot:ELU02182.1 hypothetical protein CAPTEDRAFT_218807 [Capitella teleta]
MTPLRTITTASFARRIQNVQSLRHDSTRCLSGESRIVNPRQLPELEFDEDELRLKAVMPGFTFSDLDKHGNISMSVIAKFCESLRIMMYAPSMLGDEFAVSDTLARVWKQRLVFMVSSEYEFLPGIHDKSILYKPMQVTDQIVNIGGSSYSHVNTAVSLRTKQPLYRSAVRLVLADRKSRRATPLPEWFTQHAKNVARIDVKRLTEKSVPDDPATVHYVIQESDTDYYHHANQSKYSAFCHNAAVIAARDGRLSTLGADLSRHRVRSFEGVYLREALAGDELQGSLSFDP